MNSTKNTNNTGARCPKCMAPAGAIGCSSCVNGTAALLPGSLAWVKSIAGALADVEEERFGRVTVRVPADTPREEVQRIQERLTREGLARVDYGVFYRAHPATPITWHCAKCGTVLSRDGAPCTACAPDPQFARRMREAPLVALVNVVPDGLDATGWRVAVLAVNESMGDLSDVVMWRIANEDPGGASVERQIRNGASTNVAGGIALTAYRRAIAPHKAPPPERKGATWKTRGTLYTQHADEP